MQVYEPGPDDPPVPPDDGETPDGGEEGGDGEEADDGEGGTVVIGPTTGGGRRVKYYVNDVEVNVVAERVQYYGKEGKLITESLKDYTRKAVEEEYQSLDAFLRRWDEAEKKEAVIAELEEQGVLLGALAEEIGKDFDPFDLVCHVAFGQPPLTRRERAENVRKRDYFTRFGEKARAVLGALLDKYADEGIKNVEDMSVLRLQPINELGTPVEIVKAFGGRDQYQQAIRELETELYRAG